MLGLSWSCLSWSCQLAAKGEEWDKKQRGGGKGGEESQHPIETPYPAVTDGSKGRGGTRTAGCAPGRGSGSPHPSRQSRSDTRAEGTPQPAVTFIPSFLLSSIPATPGGTAALTQLPPPHTAPPPPTPQPAVRGRAAPAPPHSAGPGGREEGGVRGGQARGRKEKESGEKGRPQHSLFLDEHHGGASRPGRPR